jgi:formylglycine-generating enzyme required for sulfatase activity
VILLVDACRNEGARGGEGIGGETQSGVVVVSSCRPSERSYEIDELQHGAFTYGLLEGLRLEGENNCATVERLDQYLRFRVPELCQLHKKSRQTPYTQAEPIEKRHLILLPRRASLADVEPLRLDALQAEAAGNLDAAEQLWWRVIAVSPVDAQAHEAIKRVALKEAAPATGPIAAPIAEPPVPSAAQPRFAPRPAWQLSRRRVISAGALAVAAAGTGVVAWRSLHRSASSPALRTIEFDYASVDENGRHERPRHAKAAVFTEDLGSRTGLDMVAIAAGRFMMGSPQQEPERQPNEGPRHLVEMPQYFIGAAPVSQAQWLAVIIAHPARLKHDLDPNPSFFHGAELPVESITWYEAEEYCLRLSAITGRDYRLPSEAQWEYACRSGTTGPFNLGPTITTDLANYCGKGGAVCGDSDGHSIASEYYAGVQYGSGAYGQGPVGVFRGTTTPAGTFPPNRFGLYDMHGNVWEFCRDIATASYDDAPQDGSAYLVGAPGAYRVLRGGSWSHNPAICRSAYRDSNLPDDLGWQGRSGFRVVCT